MKKVILFSLFASLMVFASVKSDAPQFSTNATVTCCDPPPTCPKNCPPLK